MPEMAHEWLNKVFYSILFYSIFLFTESGGLLAVSPMAEIFRVID